MVHRRRRTHFVRHWCWNARTRAERNSADRLHPRLSQPAAFDRRRTRCSFEPAFANELLQLRERPEPTPYAVRLDEPVRGGIFRFVHKALLNGSAYGLPTDLTLTMAKILLRILAIVPSAFFWWVYFLPMPPGSENWFPIFAMIYVAPVCLLVSLPTLYFAIKAKRDVLWWLILVFDLTPVFTTMAEFMLAFSQTKND